MKYYTHGTYVAPIRDGAKMGTRALHVVLQGCPVKCEWCDVPETWPRPKVDADFLEIADIMALIKKHEVQHTLVTGGEPFEQDLYPLVDVLRNANISVQIETSGYIPTKHTLWWLMTGRRPWITWSPRKGLNYKATNSTLYQHISDVKIVVDNEITLPDVIDISLLVGRGASIVFVPEDNTPVEKAYDLYLRSYPALETYMGRTRLGCRLPLMKESEKHEQESS